MYMWPHTRTCECALVHMCAWHCACVNNERVCVCKRACVYVYVNECACVIGPRKFRQQQIQINLSLLYNLITPHAIEIIIRVKIALISFFYSPIHEIGIYRHLVPWLIAHVSPGQYRWPDIVWTSDAREVLISGLASTISKDRQLTPC